MLLSEKHNKTGLLDVLTRRLARTKLGPEPDQLLPTRSLTPLHLCAALKTVPLMPWLEMGFVPHGHRGHSIHCTPLELAVYCRNMEAIRVMLPRAQANAGPQSNVASPLLIRAAEILHLSGMRLLLELRANPSARDERQLSALDVFVQRGAPRRLQVHAKTPESDPRDFEPLLPEHFSRTVDELIKAGAPIQPCGDGAEHVSCLHHMLAHVPWILWPTSLRQTLKVQLEADHQGGITFESAGVHALAVSPSEETVQIARQLLEAGASPKAQLYSSKQTALHILAAGSEYMPSRITALPPRPQEADVDLRAQAQMVKVLCEHGADVVQRDSFRNLPMHLACAVDSTSMVEHLCEEGSKFDAPWINQSDQSPLSIARPKCKAFLLSRKANLQRQREERVALLMSAESVPTTIDSMISKVTLDDLLGTQAGNGSGAPQLRDKMPSVTAQEGTAGGKTDGSGDSSAGALKGSAAPSDAEVPAPQAKLKLVHKTKGRDLCAKLHFDEGAPFSVIATRHVLGQLRMLEQAHIEAAFRLMHRLAGGDDELILACSKELDDRGLFVSCLNPKVREPIWVVWERDKPLKGSPDLHFFEERHAVRVWSVETTESHLQHVAQYVARAWDLGANAAEVTRQGNGTVYSREFPMGTTATADRPGDTWHPQHAEDTGELQVPYILKWYRVSDALVHYLLVLAPQGGGSDARQSDFQLPMLLDEHERKLASFADDDPGGASPSSSSSRLVVGRSGTGKTSIALEILMRLHTSNKAIAHEAQAVENGGWSIAQGGGSDACPHGHKNTIFVCKSKTLGVSVSKHFDDLVCVLGDERSSDASNASAEVFAHGGDLARPLFVSTSELYVLLDHTLASTGRARSFFSTSAEAAAFVRDLSGTGDLLASFDCDEDGPQESGSGGSSSATTAPVASSKGDVQRRLLTYERFRQFVEKSTRFTRELRKVGEMTVYREIFSYIKGSAEAMETDSGFLSEDQYVNMAHKVSSLPEELRPLVYALFVEYKSKRRELFDLSDLIFHLIRAKRNGKLAGTRIDRFVVDEVQDLMLAEVKPLLELSSDKNGLFLCGDTAQTISRGVGFRFADVKTLFHGLDPSVVTPALDHLCLNYRTHAGIVECAACVVQLLLERFPTAVDRLPAERGHFAGPQPALMHETDSAALVESMLAADEVGLMEMGANQVVLVRQEACKGRLPAELRAGLTLTIEESKGLEFDDVCLYNFVSDSPVTEVGKSASRELWQVLSGTADFDLHKHLLLAEELKSFCEPATDLKPTSPPPPKIAWHTAPPLVPDSRDPTFAHPSLPIPTTDVGLTRARKRCFIFDANEDARAPLFEALSSRGVAEKGAEQQLSVQATKAGRSTEADWLNRGNTLFDNKSFREAEKCFLKAHNTARALDAGSRRLSRDAESLQGQERVVCYRSAAIALLLSPDDDNILRAAWAFCLAGQAAENGRRGVHYRDAGRVMQQKLRGLRAAAACYVEAAYDDGGMLDGKGGIDEMKWEPKAWNAALDALIEDASDHPGLDSLHWLAKNASKQTSNKWKHAVELHIMTVRDSLAEEREHMRIIRD